LLENHHLSIDRPRKQPINSLISQEELEKKLPISDAIASQVISGRRRIERILEGRDPRLLVIIGPCSIHDSNAAIEYATRMKTLSEQYQNQLEIVMRTYFEKPRTAAGWKGMISDPLLDGSSQVNLGIEMARKVLLDINRLGLPTATEFLDIIMGQYIADLISWGAIGARTTESQIHRQMASALSCPIGFKNGTDGNIDIAIDAVRVASASHIFVSPNKKGEMTIYQTLGNPYGHVVMRGGKKPNYSAKDIALACHKLRDFHLPEHVVVDLSHGNCQKRYRHQLSVSHSMAEQIRSGSKAILGVMIESFLIEGSQQIVPAKPLIYGQSVTDSCLSWPDTEDLLYELSEAVKARF